MRYSTCECASEQHNSPKQPHREQCCTVLYTCGGVRFLRAESGGKGFEKDVEEKTIATPGSNNNVLHGIILVQRYSARAENTICAT